MHFEWWSWSSYVLGVITALLPSALALLYFVWRAPVVDERGEEQGSTPKQKVR